MGIIRIIAGENLTLPFLSYLDLTAKHNDQKIKNLIITINSTNLLQLLPCCSIHSSNCSFVSQVAWVCQSSVISLVAKAQKKIKEKEVPKRRRKKRNLWVKKRLLGEKETFRGKKRLLGGKRDF
jgi:hypothetical protein